MANRWPATRRFGTHEFRAVLDGPRSDAAQLARAAERLATGGTFGYRLLYPPMQLGRYEVFWHRPLAAFFAPADDEPTVLADAPLGYLTCYESARPRPGRPAAELWPRLLQRGPHLAAVRLFTANHESHYRQTMFNVRKMLDAWELCGRKPLPRDFARQLLTLPKEDHAGRVVGITAGRGQRCGRRYRTVGRTAALPGERG